MTVATIILCVGLLSFALMQTAYVLRFSQILNAPSNVNQINNDDCPLVDVVMCIRGSDPHLASCLRAVLDQDYPNYVFHAVVDSPQDPAMQVVNDICDPLPNAEVHLLHNYHETCSLKCSSLVQVITKLEDSKFVAILDSDTVPDKDWLRRLISGFDYDNIGAVSAIRWYCPPDNQMGTLVRYIWNAAAIVQMVLYRIAWGGSLVISRNAITELKLTDRWNHAFCEDTMLRSELEKENYRTAIRSDLFVVNREACRLSDFSQWLKRQLLTVRLYHTSWSLIIAHAVGTTLIPLVTIIAAIVAASFGLTTQAMLLAVGYIAYQLINLWLLTKISRTVADKAGNHLVPTDQISLAQMWLASLIAQFIYFWAIVQASTLKSVQWRGIDYKVGGPWNIRMIEYSPFESLDVDSDQSL